MTYINFDRSNNDNIKLVERNFNISRLNCKTVILNDRLYNKFEEIESIASQSPRGVFLDVTGLSPEDMAYINTISAVLDSLGYVPMIVVVNKGRLIDLSNHYKFNDLADINEPSTYIELVRMTESLVDEIYK